MKFISTILLLLVLLIGSCNHDDPDLSCNGRIKNNDLTGIQNCVRGSWKINYKRSAAVGNSKTMLSNSFIKITADDSIFYFLEGDLTAITQLDWALTQNGYTLDFKHWRGHTLIFDIEKFKGDTLFISTDDKKITYALTPSQFVPVMNCVGLLKYKALDQIRHCIWGYWQLHYWEGGISGDIRQDFTNSFVEFLPNDSIYFVDQGDLTVEDQIEWGWRLDEITHDSIYTMLFQDWRDYSYEWVVKEIRDDTLVLYDNGNDGFNYYLTKKIK